MKLQRTTEHKLNPVEGEVSERASYMLVRKELDRRDDLHDKVQSLFDPIRNLWRDLKTRSLARSFCYGFLRMKEAHYLEDLVEERIYNERSEVIGYRFRSHHGTHRLGDLISVIAELRSDDTPVITFRYSGGSHGKNTTKQFTTQPHSRAEFVRFLADVIHRV